MITVNGKYTGTVDEVGLRVLKIRENNGKLLTIANGEIKEIENFNKEIMMVVEKPIVSYRENPQNVIDILEKVCIQINEKHADDIIDNFKVGGLGSLNNHVTGYEYVVLGKVKEASYFDLAAETRKQIAIAFFEEGIRLAEAQHHYKTIVEYKK